MIFSVIQIAFLCIVAGAASIPLSFQVTSSPVIVWVGNALGSFLSAFFVIFIAERITDKKFENKMKKHKASNKIITVMEQGDDNKKVQKASIFINKHGLRIFALFCPIFPGALISTAAVYLLDLDKRIYKIWLTVGIFIVSGLYVFGYWLTFVR